MFQRNNNVDKELDQVVRAMVKEAKQEYDGVLPIMQAGEPVLRTPSADYVGQLAPKTFASLIEVMRTTMLDAPGVGLAAPQIGLGLRFAVLEDHVSEQELADMREQGIEDPRESAELPFRVIINPSYTPIGQETRSFYEGCLSVEGYQAVRKRWLDIDAQWTDEHGKQHREQMHGWPARIFQHETDHLHGELYIDKAQLRSLSADELLGEYWYDPVPTEAARELGFTLE